MEWCLEAGESTFQTFAWTETRFHALGGSQPLLHALFSVKTLSRTLLGPAFVKPKPGYGVRSDEAISDPPSRPASRGPEPASRPASRGPEPEFDLDPESNPSRRALDPVLTAAISSSQVQNPR